MRTFKLDSFKLDRIIESILFAFLGIGLAIFIGIIIYLGIYTIRYCHDEIHKTQNEVTTEISISDEIEGG